MIQENFNASEQALNLSVRADIISTNAQDLASGLEKILERYETLGPVTLDLSTAKMVDSMGLNMLLGFIRSVKRRGGNPRLLIGSGSVNRVMLFSHLDQLAEIIFQNRRVSSAAR